MNTKQIKKDIKEAIRGLRIPNNLREDAEQEGFVAFLEGEDIRKSVRLWLKKELDFRDNLGSLGGIENKEYLLHDPNNNQRRINGADPQYEIEEVGGELVAFEKI